MRPLQHRTIATALTAVLMLIVASCGTAPTAVDTAEMSAPKLVQTAQSAADRGDYTLAMDYYRGVQVRFPADTERVLWASYEIAFLHHKMDNDPEAIRLLDLLIADYGTEIDPTMPPGPRILAEKVKANLLAAAASKPASAEPASAEPASAEPAPTEPDGTAPAPATPEPEAPQAP